MVETKIKRDPVRDEVFGLLDHQIQQIIDDYDSNDPRKYRRGQLAMAAKVLRKQAGTWNPESPPKG